MAMTHNCSHSQIGDSADAVGTGMAAAAAAGTETRTGNGTGTATGRFTTTIVAGASAGAGSSVGAGAVLSEGKVAGGDACIFPPPPSSTSAFVGFSCGIASAGISDWFTQQQHTGIAE
jgi:hypothetical protein